MIILAHFGDVFNVKDSYGLVWIKMDRNKDKMQLIINIMDGDESDDDLKEMKDDEGE